MKTLTLICFIIYLSIISSGDCMSLPCVNMRNLHCYPINNMTSCVQINYNQTRGDWTESQKFCAANGGRLLWLSDQFGIKHLQTTIMHQHGNFSQIHFGLMVSTHGNKDLFWKSPVSETSITCGQGKTKLCSTTSSSSVCRELGCCMKEGRCAYPDSQSLVNAPTDLHVVPSATTDTTRKCVGITLAWQLKTFDCLQATDQSTITLCEYKCHNDWPAMTTNNITADLTTDKNDETTGDVGNHTTQPVSSVQKNGAIGSSGQLGNGIVDLNLLLKLKLGLLSASVSMA